MIFLGTDRTYCPVGHTRHRQTLQRLQCKFLGTDLSISVSCLRMFALLSQPMLLGTTLWCWPSQCHQQVETSDPMTPANHDHLGRFLCRPKEITQIVCYICGASKKVLQHIACQNQGEKGHLFLRNNLYHYDPTSINNTRP